MKARIVQIGNSRGIRIPKPLIEQAGLRDEVEMIVRDSAIVIRPYGHPRSGWEEAFRGMAARGDDQLRDEAPPTQWDEDEWEW
jgi:antitoxin MazE